MLTLWRRPLVRMGLDRSVIESQATPLLDERHDQVICGTGEGEVQAIGLRDATLRWRYAYVAPFESAPVAFRQPLAHGQRLWALALGAKDGGVLALEAATGRLLWRASVEGEVRAAPVVDGDTLYVTTARNHLVALDASDGSVRWTFERPPPVGMSVLGHASALMENGRVFTSFADGMAVAVNANTGASMWQRPLSLGGDRFRDADADPLALPDGIAFASLSDGVTVVSPDDGHTVWQQSLRNVAQLAKSERQAPGLPRVFAGDADGVVTAMSAQTGRILWRRPLEQTAIRGLRAWQDKLIVFANEQGMRVLSQEDGRLLETVSLGGWPGGDVAVGRTHAAHLTGQGALLLWSLQPSSTGAR